MNTSWSHLLVRPLVPPLLAIGATPNQVTTVRLLSGLAAAGLAAWGTPHASLWAGVVWLLSALLDRLDGELARIGGLSSAFGKRYDYFTDTGLSAVFFLALGVGLRHAWGGWTVALGALACLSQIGNCLTAEAFERSSPSADKVIPSLWGFDADDALYLLGPLLWLPVSVRLTAVVLAAIGTTGFLIAFTLRLAALRRRLALSATRLEPVSKAP